MNAWRKEQGQWNDPPWPEESKAAVAASQAHQRITKIGWAARKRSRMRLRQYRHALSGQAVESRDTGGKIAKEQSQA